MKESKDFGRRVRQFYGVDGYTCAWDRDARSKNKITVWESTVLENCCQALPEQSAVEVVGMPVEASPDEVRALAECLTDDELDRAGRFKFYRDRRVFIVARATLRKLLAVRLDVQPKAVELAYGPNGKPSLAQRFAESKLRFNVSHSGDLVLYAFGRSGEIGIDVEKVRAIPEADAIAAKFFSRRENESYLALDPKDRPIGFFNCWTRKEAFIKAIGDGLRYPLHLFEVSLAPGEPAQILQVGSTLGKDCGWTIRSFVPQPGFIGAVVTEKS